MADKAPKKARRPMTSVRMWKVVRDYVQESAVITDSSSVSDLLDVLKDEALEEVAAQ